VYVIDPVNGRVAASHFGGVSLTQLTEFLDRGAGGIQGGSLSPADSAMARGDELLGRGERAAAESEYRKAIELGGKSWTRREPALAQLAWTLLAERLYENGAALATAEAPSMARAIPFERVVLAGLLSANASDTASWAVTARARMVPLAAEARKISGVSRNDRFQLYQELTTAAQISGDKATMQRWGEQWLGEIDKTDPKNEDERTALDVARVDAVSILGTPERAIPALQASERAMPNNYNASLRLAQILSQAKRYDEAVAACDRGLEKVDGPLGRTWLLETKADALIGKGDTTQARQVLDDAQASANAIIMKSNRDSNLRRIAAMTAKVGK
jgi:predicted negative regulator of RcsB-dependent stress response